MQDGIHSLDGASHRFRITDIGFHPLQILEPGLNPPKLAGRQVIQSAHGIPGLEKGGY